MAGRTRRRRTMVRRREAGVSVRRSFGGRAKGGARGVSLVRTLLQRFLRTPLSPFFLASRGLTRALAESATLELGAVLDVGCGNKPYAHLLAIRLRPKGRVGGAVR